MLVAPSQRAETTAVRRSFPQGHKLSTWVPEHREGHRVGPHSNTQPAALCVCVCVCLSLSLCVCEREREREADREEGQKQIKTHKTNGSVTKDTFCARAARPAPSGQRPGTDHHRCRSPADRNAPIPWRGRGGWQQGSLLFLFFRRGPTGAVVCKEMPPRLTQARGIRGQAPELGWGSLILSSNWPEGWVPGGRTEA